MKEMIKKLLCAMLSCLLIFAVSCGTSSSVTNSDDSQSESEESSQTSLENESSSAGEDSSSDSVEDPKEEPSEPEYYNENHETYLTNGYSAIFADPYLKDGEDKEPILFTGSVDSPSWNFSQWFTKYDLTGALYHYRAYSKQGKAALYTSDGANVNGAYVPAKTLYVDTTTGLIQMRLNAQAEYDEPRKSG